jgi:hypothetical protein
MKRITVSISLPDNGGITFFGPLSAAVASKSPSGVGQQRLYLCANHDPLEVGKTLLAMLADLQMSEAALKPEIDVDISF